MDIDLSDNVIIPQHFGCLLYVRKTHEYIPYDQITTDVLLHCVESSLLETPEAFQKEISPEQRDAFFKLGKKLKFFNRKGKFLGKVIKSEPPRNHLLGPLTLHLSITQSCDLNCRHCFAAPEMSMSDKRLLSDRQLEALFGECADMGCLRIALTGGEPLNRPDLFDIIDVITDHGIDVCLTTNGLRIDGRVSKKLAGRPFAWVNVSLDGATPKTNDAVRGKGTFERVTANLKKFMKWRVPYALSVTLTPLNIHEIPVLPGLAREVGADLIMLRSCYPIGRAHENDDLCLNFSQYSEALLDLRKTKRPIRIVPTSCEMGGLEDIAVIWENFGCAAGNSVATVYHNGDVSPCSLIGDGIELDNLVEMSFNEIWNQSRGFRKIRSLSVPEVCGQCDAYGECSGGCRARAWEEFHNMEAPDPWCKKSHFTFCPDSCR